MDLKELYSDIILEYSQDKTYRKPLMRPTVRNRGVNPSCGDNIELELQIEDHRIKEVAILGKGCAISEASAGVMAELIQGKTVEEVRILSDLFVSMIQKKVTEEQQLKKLEAGIAFQNISNMPARVKCAVLSWHTLEEALSKEA